MRSEQGKKNEKLHFTAQHGAEKIKWRVNYDSYGEWLEEGRVCVVA